MPVNLGLYTNLTMLMVTTCQKPHVEVSDLGPPGKMDRLKLRFFSKRVYASRGSCARYWLTCGLDMDDLFCLSGLSIDAVYPDR